MKDIFPKIVGAEVFLLGNIILGLWQIFFILLVIYGKVIINASCLNIRLF